MTAFPAEARITAGQDVRLARSLGFGAAVTCSLCGFLYLLALAGNYAVTGSVSVSSGRPQALAVIISLVWNQALVVLFAALRQEVPDQKRILADLAVIFTALMSALSSINWFAQLAVVPKIDPAGNAAILALLDAHGGGSILYAMEHLGWGLFFGIAALCGAFAMQGGRLEAWIRWLLAAAGLLSLIHLGGIAGSDPALSLLGYPAWGVLLPAATVLLALRLRRRL